MSLRKSTKKRAEYKVLAPPTNVFEATKEHKMARSEERQKETERVILYLRKKFTDEAFLKEKQLAARAQWKYPPKERPPKVKYEPKVTAQAEFGFTLAELDELQALCDTEKDF